MYLIQHPKGDITPVDAMTLLIHACVMQEQEIHSDNATSSTTTPSPLPPSWPSPSHIYTLHYTTHSSTHLTLRIMPMADRMIIIGSCDEQTYNMHISMSQYINVTTFPCQNITPNCYRKIGK